MRYIITHTQFERTVVFFTEWFSIENNFVEGMTVIDMQTNKFLADINIGWEDIEEDHL